MIDPNDSDDEIVRKCYEASGKYYEPLPGDGGAALLAVLRTRHPALHKVLPHGRTACNDLFSGIVHRDDLKLVAEMVKMGADVNGGARPGEFVKRAAAFASLNMVKWLVEHGAQINTPIYGKVGCFALIDATINNNCEMIDYFLSQGAVLNFVNAGRMSPLDYAAPGSEMYNYLRSLGAKSGSELPQDHLPPPPKQPVSVREYLGSLGFGDVEELPLHEVVPGDPPVRLLYISSPDGPWHGIFTDGMSAQEQSVPPDADPHHSLRHTELFIFLPFDWKIDESLLADQTRRWPIDWLRRIASWPFENDTYLRRATIFANGEPPQPLADNTSFSCILAAAGSGDWTQWTRPDGVTVEFVLLGPLYTEERDLEKSLGMPELLKRLSFLSTTLNLNRPNVAMWQ